LLPLLFQYECQINPAILSLASNALTWLKRLNLSGRDLPELYVKIREKMLAYGTEGNKDVRALEKEIGRLGILLGDEIRLDNIPTCYFLLLGQSIMADVIKKKDAREVADHD
jgi:CRISPR-associated protein Csh1